MGQTSLESIGSFGYGFVDSRYLEEGEDEYRFRFQQVPMDGYRHLRDDEIASLEAQGNRCAGWDDVWVRDPFDVSLVRRCTFYGLVRLGPFEKAMVTFHDFALETGVVDSRIISSDILENAAVHGCGHVSHYIIGRRCIVYDVDELQTTDHSKFGVGIVKEGEDESVRVTIDLMNEAGGREVLPFVGMNSADAWLWAKTRGDGVLMDRLKRLTEKTVTPKRGVYGRVGDGSVLKNCEIVKDVDFGPACYAKGCNKLKNLTVDSSVEEPTQLGEGIELVNGIVGRGSRIFYGCKAIRFVTGTHCNLKYGARLIHSFLGDNGTVSCCEVLNNLIFPFHEEHHNNSFLIASLVMGQSNMAAGATIGSNHNSRGNDGELVAGRGFWPALSTTLKHDSRFASYTLIAKGDYPCELDVRLPFGLVADNTVKGRREVMPAYWWMYNMYALVRNSWKFGRRDRRIDRPVAIETDFLPPRHRARDRACHHVDGAVVRAERRCGQERRGGMQETWTQPSQAGAQARLRGADLFHRTLGDPGEDPQAGEVVQGLPRHACVLCDEDHRRLLSQARPKGTRGVPVALRRQTRAVREHGRPAGAAASPRDPHTRHRRRTPGQLGCGPRALQASGGPLR